jgi:nucleoside-diphosphate-sugar epimerase
MKILLTGAAGFVGANIAAVLARMVAAAVVRGDSAAHLVAADFRAPAAATTALLEPLAQHITWLRIDMRDRAALCDAVTQGGITHIVHGAAVTVPGGEEELRAEEIVDINLGGTINLLGVAARAPTVARVLLLSSSGVYGAPEGQAPALLTQSEDGPFDLGNLYGITKYSSELLAARWGELAHKPMAAARLSAVYGPLERASRTRPGTSTMHGLMAALREGRAITVAGPQVGRDWTYAEDIGRAVAALLGAPAWHWPVYNVSCGRRCTFAEVVSAFTAQGLRASFVDDPKAADVAMVPAQERRPLDIARLQKDTGFVPRYGLAAGIAAWLAAEPRG